MQLPKELAKKQLEELTKKLEKVQEKKEKTDTQDNFNAGMFLPTDLSGREKVQL